MRRPFVVGNWKMFGLSADLPVIADIAAKANSACRQVDSAIAPPFTMLAKSVDLVGSSALAIGAQDCHGSTNGAHTGDVAAPMVKDAGARFVIVGHSERRLSHGESDSTIAAKAAAAIAVGLHVILCVGEPIAVREAGKTMAFIEAQLRGSLPISASSSQLTIAYEPIWAIGSGRTANVADVQAVHRHIRTLLSEIYGQGDSFRILYGGSVKPDNALALFSDLEVDGGLIGGASLKAESFNALIDAAVASTAKSL